MNYSLDRRIACQLPSLIPVAFPLVQELVLVCHFGQRHLGLIIWILIYARATRCDQKAFRLKHLIKICQSCRKNYDGQNDTLGLVLAREERRLVSNLATGKQFFGRESNSHYHLHMQCIKAVEPSFEAKEMVIPEEVEQRLNNYQRLYLKMCFQLQ